MSEDWAQQVAFLVLLVLGGHVGMVLILSTILLSRHILRNPIFVNFCITWMLYTLSYTLLLYAGQAKSPQPTFRLCMTQSAMVYGAPPLVAVSVFVFILHLFLTLREKIRGEKPFRWPKLRLAIMLAAPYMAFISVLAVTIKIAYSHPVQVRRSSFYCSIGIQESTYLSAGISVLAISLALVVETLTATTVHRHWRDFRVMKSFNISILIRTLVMLICSVIALLTSLTFLIKRESLVSYLVIACLPLAAFLNFGTQSDILRAWCFWRWKGEI